jgi:hypothetical protein
VAIGIDRDPNRTVAHLILHVRDGLVVVEMSAEEIAESKRLRAINLSAPFSSLLSDRLFRDCKGANRRVVALTGNLYIL